MTATACNEQEVFVDKSVFSAWRAKKTNKGRKKFYLTLFPVRKEVLHFRQCLHFLQAHVFISASCELISLEAVSFRHFCQFFSDTMQQLRWETQSRFVVTHSDFHPQQKKDWIRRQIWDDPSVQQQQRLLFGRGRGRMSRFWVSAVLFKNPWGSLGKRFNCNNRKLLFGGIKIHCWSKYTI